MPSLMTSILSLRSYRLVGGTLKLISGVVAAASAPTGRRWRLRDAVLVVRKRRAGFLVLDPGAQSGVGCTLSTQYLRGKRIEWNVAANEVPDAATNTK